MIIMQEAFERVPAELAKRIVARCGHQVQAVVLFGSAARGEARWSEDVDKRSDIDMLVVTDAATLNCRERFTFLSVIEAILDHVQQLRTAQRSRERQLGVLRSALSDRRCLVILDEIDLLPAKDVAELIHHICSLPRTSLVCIAASRQPLLALPEAARSRMSPRQILFPRFQPEELASIITRALQKALTPNAWQPGVVRPIADAAYGDARRAFALLRHAVLRADEAGAPIVTQEHLVLSNFDHFHAREDELLASLSEHHRLLYDLVSVRGPVPAAALERAYRKACRRRELEPVATRTLNKYLAALCGRHLLEREHGPGTGGWVYRPGSNRTHKR